MDIDLDNLDWKTVESSNVAGIALEDGQLFVKFKNGGVYRYDDGAHEEIDSLFQALSEAADTSGKSVGSTFYAVVRRPEIPGTKVHPQPEAD